MKEYQKELAALVCTLLDVKSDFKEISPKGVAPVDIINKAGIIFSALTSIQKDSQQIMNLLLCSDDELVELFSFVVLNWDELNSV